MDNNLRFLVEDPGNQRDTYLDATTLNPYRYEQGEKQYSTKNGVWESFGGEKRSVFKIRYYNYSSNNKRRY